MKPQEDVEMAIAREEARLMEEQKQHGIKGTHKAFIPINTHAPQPDYMNWSIGSFFLCIVWGVLAFTASNKVRRFNEAKNYAEAARYSRIAYRHNVSALACFVVLFFILLVPYAIALAYAAPASKYPNLHQFFG